MSQKHTKPLTPSHSTMKNTVFNFEDIPFNSSSQPISTDSPFPRKDLESRSNSIRINNAQKNRGGKLALLLDNSKPGRVSIFTKKNKTPATMTSLSPGRRGFKSNKISDQEKGARLQDSSGNKSYMRADSEKEGRFKAILKLNSTDAAMDVYNKETQRPRKYKKGHKLSSGCKENLLQGQSFNQMSCNMSHISDTSCFISGLTNIALQNNASVSQQVPYNSPKQTLLTTVQSQIVDFNSVTPPKVSVKPKKNSSIDKAHLNVQSGQAPHHRKTGAISNVNESSVLGKSFSKFEQRRSCVSHASPNKSKSVLRSTSRDVKANKNKLSELRTKFDTMIGNYDTQIASALVSQNILRKMKQEYEAAIEGLLNDKEKDNNSENNRLREENARLKNEVAELRNEQEKLQVVIKNMKDTRGSSPCQSGIPTEKRVPNIKSIDSPPLTQNSKYSTSNKGDKESDRLNQILMRQQGTITTLRKKEAKMMKLIYAIKKQGVDVEKIYDAEVKGKYEQLVQENGIATLNKLDMQEDSSDRQEEGKQESVIQDSEDDASVDYEAIDLGKGVKASNNLNSAMKNKLKLDFTVLKKPEEGGQTMKNSNGEPVGFHEEFMSKFEEFSLSWRKETMLQKNP